MTGVTIITREPEWSDNDRNRLLALARYEAQVCQCGWHESIAMDETNPFMPTDRVCPVCAGRARYERLQAERDRAEVELLDAAKSSPAIQRTSDGRTTYMRLLGDDEVANLRKRGD